MQSFHFPDHSSIPRYDTRDMRGWCLLLSQVHSTADCSSSSDWIPAPQPHFLISDMLSYQLSLDIRNVDVLTALSLSSPGLVLSKQRSHLEKPKSWPWWQSTASLLSTNLQLPYIPNITSIWARQLDSIDLSKALFVQRHSKHKPTVEIWGLEESLRSKEAAICANSAGKGDCAEHPLQGQVEHYQLQLLKAIQNNL